MRIIDLSLPIDNQMRGVNVTAARKLETDGWNATTLELYSHCGTHMDAPAHFINGHDTIDQQCLKVCVGEALVINLAPTEPAHLTTVDDLRDYHDQINSGSRLLFRTDWYKQYGTDAYRNQLPRISIELARWLVNRNVAMIGVEGPSVADVNNMQELTEVHQTLFTGGVLIVEGLANLDRLSQPVVHFIGLPLSVTGGDGSPIRAIAIEDEANG
jgi:kynurenine formamidase